MSSSTILWGRLADTLTAMTWKPGKQNIVALLLLLQEIEKAEATPGLIAWITENLYRFRVFHNYTESFGRSYEVWDVEYTGVVPSLHEEGNFRSALIHLHRRATGI